MIDILWADREETAHMKISFEDMATTFAADGVDMRTTRIGDDIVLTRYKCAKGTDFSGAVQGLPHNACPCEHWGYVVSGQMNVSNHNGQSFEFRTGDAFHLRPGHMPQFPIDTEFLDYSPRHQVEVLLANMGLKLP